MPNQVKTLEEIAEKVERKSRQGDIDPDNFFISTYKWVKGMERNAPEWGYTRSDYVDNRERDRWLLKMVQEEPHLASVLSTSVTLDANRQYRLVGGRNQVLRYNAMFNQFDSGLGIKAMQELNAMNYYNTDVGAIVEIERTGNILSNLYHVDSTEVRLRNHRKGLIYGNSNEWKAGTFYRLASQKSTVNAHNLLGYSAVSRCVKLAQTMIALVEHNLEKLGHLAPKGILLIKAEDITQAEWDEAMAERGVTRLANTGENYYDGVMTIVDRTADAQLLALSSLPDGWDSFMFTDYMMKGYALAFNRDVRTYWSVNSGNFGAGTEAQIQSEKATYAGGAEFILGSQDKIQSLLPQSLLFAYEVSDTRGRLLEAQMEKVLIDSAKTLTEIGLTTEQAKSWLAQAGVIPDEWTEDNEETVSDSGYIKERLLETIEVQRAIERFKDEPIVSYESPSFWYPKGRMKTLWNSGADAVGKSWMVSRTTSDHIDSILNQYPEIPSYEKRKLKRNFSPDMSEVQTNIYLRKLDARNRYWKRKNRQVTIGDYEGEAERGNYMYLAGAASYLEQADEDSPNYGEITAILAAILFLLANQSQINDDRIMDIRAQLSQIISGEILEYLDDLRYYSDAAIEGAELAYPDRWDSRLAYLAGLGLIDFASDTTLIGWGVGDTEHCKDCAELDGVVRTVAEWRLDTRRPQSPQLECGGFNCQCFLYEA